MTATLSHVVDPLRGCDCGMPAEMCLCLESGSQDPVDFLPRLLVELILCTSHYCLDEAVYWFTRKNTTVPNYHKKLFARGCTRRNLCFHVQNCNHTDKKTAHVTIDLRCRYRINPRPTRFVSGKANQYRRCLLYTSPSPRDKRQSRMPSSA